MKSRLLKILFLTTSALFLFCAFSLINLQKVFAESEKESFLFSPDDALCYADYKNAISLDYSGDIALICNNKLVVYSSGNYVTYDNVISPKTIKRISESTLLFSDNGSIYTIDYDGNSFKTKSSTLKDTNEDNIGCNFFDINQEYLVTAYGTNAIIYKRNQNNLQEFTKKEIVSITNDTPICLNENNELFYFLDNNLCKKVIGGNFSSICPATAKNIIANENFIYLLNNDSISYTENSEHPQEITPIKFSVNNTDTNYVLGTISNPTAITFKNENLFVADEHALQEFTIEEDKLMFTGFAISKGNTSFNRIDSSAFDIEKNGNNIAVIDNNKISIIKNGEEKTFVNFPNNAFTPTNIALGREKLLISSNERYYFVDLEDNSKTETKTLNNIKDLIFANNNFYILTNTDTDSVVYNIDQNTLESSKVYALEGQYSNFALDVNGKFIFNENGETKILTDLVGNVFSLKGGQLNDNLLKLPNGLNVENKNIKSFAMDIENKEIFLILENEEVILFSTDFDNKTISEIEIDGSFRTTSENAEDISSLKVYTITEDANAYQIDIKDNKIEYKGIFENFNENKPEFVLIYVVPSPYQDFYILSGFDKNNLEITLLVNKNDLEEKKNYIIELNAYVYISTPVDMYYLPIINIDRAFSLTENENIIRLTKNQGFAVLNEFEINNASFYYGKTEINGKETIGFIPKDFTVVLLSKNYIKQKFSYIDIKATSLFDNDSNEIKELEEAKNIKLLEKGEEKSFIEYKESGISYFGYISNEKIIEPSNNTLKIFICLAILTVCAFITTIYFGFIRKNN